MVNCTRIISYLFLMYFFLYIIKGVQCGNLLQEDYQDDVLDGLVVKVKDVFSNYRKNIDRNNLTDASGMPLLGDERVLA